MARTVAPEKAPEITAPQYKIEKPDFSQLDKFGTYLIKASDNNFKLYSDMLYKTESAKLFQQYSDKPMELSAALGKLPEMFKDLPENLQEEMTRKIYIDSVGLVQKAQNNFLVAQDQQNKQNALGSAEMSKALMEQQYQNILQNHISPKEQKDEISNEIFGTQYNNLDAIADLQDHNGKYMFSDAQRKAFRNVDNLEYDGFRQFVDTMILNDNDDLQQTKDYYTKFVLAPDRFMKENYMNRETYDKSRTYIEKELKRAGAEIEQKRFNQTVGEYVSLQIEDKPGTLEALKQSGLLSKDLIDHMEKVNAKFNEIDPSKTESPVAMLDLLRIINSSEKNPAPANNDEQQKILEQGTVALDSIAEYAQTYGLDPKKVQTMRETVANWETNTAFAPIINNFAEIIDNFDVKLDAIRRQSTGKDRGKQAFLTSMSDNDYIKLMQLNDLFAKATDIMNQQVRNQNWDGVRETQRMVQKQAAQIKYDIVSGGWINWDKYEQNPDQTFTTPNGRVVKVKDFTFDGDVQFEIVE